MYRRVDGSVRGGEGKIISMGISALQRGKECLGDFEIRVDSIGLPDRMVRSVHVYEVSRFRDSRDGVRTGACDVFVCGRHVRLEGVRDEYHGVGSNGMIAYRLGGRFRLCVFLRL